MKKFKAKSLYRCRILVPVRLEVSSVTTFYNFLPPATTRQQECGLTKGQNCGGLGQWELTRLILSKCNISFDLESNRVALYNVQNYCCKCNARNSSSSIF